MARFFASPFSLVPVVSFCAAPSLVSPRRPFWWLPVAPSAWLWRRKRCTTQQAKNIAERKQVPTCKQGQSRHSPWLGWRWRQLRQRRSATTWSTTGVALRQPAEASQHLRQDESRMLQLGARPSCCKERAIASGGGKAERTGAPSAPPSAPWPVPGLGRPRRQAAWLFLAECCHHCQRRCS